MSNVKAPAPIHLLRSHTSSIAALFVSRDNEHIYSGDASGHAVITSTRTLRAIASWKAHQDGFLGIEEWENGNAIITHGRDNKLHVWDRLDEQSITSGIGSSAALPGLPTPTLRFSMDVNALNYCRFSLLPTSIIGSIPENLPSANITSRVDSSSECTALIALPNLIQSSEADVWSIPSYKRLHAAIGHRVKASIFSGDGRTGENATGIIMSLRLFEPTSSSAESSRSTPELRILIAYESGAVILRRYANPGKLMSVEGKGWEMIWETKLHQEAIMAMQVSSNNQFALTVSADHIVGRYNLTVRRSASAQDGTTFYRTKHPGNGCISIRDDGRVCAIGGWDGKVRLYSTKSFKPVGTLEYHKDGCQALSFATSASTDSGSQYKELEELHEDEDEDMLDEEKLKRSRWLVSGGKDKRIAIWELISFEKF
ncbi:WD40-repeat-containing domain protein [Lentinula aciculospora]|uniref:ASTRA-associated protein 1 n=1 Tax=Lentinula aciculospora TaxID=153920 RepID=A0A9W9ARV9_9AGAR|nr:WD40-repeat-containing domain protein [Lentinula aciculospora]KAJ4487812.1 WD40-repeat-containing domain protein [Lentinula aciculospora]